MVTSIYQTRFLLFSCIMTISDQISENSSKSLMKSSVLHVLIFLLMRTVCMNFQSIYYTILIIQALNSM